MASLPWEPQVNKQSDKADDMLLSTPPCCGGCKMSSQGVLESRVRLQHVLARHNRGIHRKERVPGKLYVVLHRQVQGNGLHTMPVTCHTCTLEPPVG